MEKANVSAFDAIISEAAQAAVMATDSSELPLLENTLNPPREFRILRRSNAVGFGLTEVIQWASPYIVASTIWYAKVWFDEGKSVIERRTRRLVRKLLRDRTDSESARERLTTELKASPRDQQEHTELVRRYLETLGLVDGRADTVATTVVATFFARR